MTKQEYYDLLVRCAGDGTFPAKQFGQCCYRTKDGRKCAIGLLIPDHLYRPEFEGETVYNSQIQEVVCCPEGLTIGNLDDIQYLHDIASVSSNFFFKFVSHLNELSCFQGVHQVDPTSLRQSETGDECDLAL